MGVIYVVRKTNSINGSIFYLHDELIIFKSIEKPECLNLEQLTQEIFDTENYYQFVRDIKFSGANISKSFESKAIKKYFHSQELSKSEKIKFITKYEQKNCSEILAHTPDGSEMHFDITEKNAYKLILRPKENSDIDRIIFKLRRMSGYKAIEKTVYLKFKSNNTCAETKSDFETHPVEIFSMISWNKPIQLRRIISEKLLKSLAQLVMTSSSIPAKSIAECEKEPVARAISSVRNYDPILDF